MKCLTEYIKNMTSNNWIQQIYTNHGIEWKGTASNNARKLETIILKKGLKEEIKEEVKVEVKNRAVSVTAKNSRSAFSRVFGLSGVDYDKIDGKLENGLLTITLPKTPESKSRELALK